MNIKMAKGVACFILACIFLSFASAGVKLLETTVPTVVIIFLQSLICFILTLPAIFSYGIKHLYTSRLKLHLVRDICGLAWFFLFFESLKTLPLANATLLSNAIPIFMPFILLVWLKTKIRNDLWWGIIIGFVGIMLILRPRGNDFFYIGAVLALGSAVLGAVTLAVVRELTTTEPNSRILLYYFLVMTIGMAPFAFHYWIPLSHYQMLVILGIGVFIWLAQYIFAYSFKFASTSALTPLTYANVVFAAILDWFMWHHIPTLLTFIGIVLVIIGGTWAVVKENQMKGEKYDEKKIS